MCGIVGIVDKKNKWSLNKRESIVKDMLSVLKHRGGDHTDFKSSGNLTIGHTRLAIVDTSSSADQPMFDQNNILAFNGEVYNHLELRNKFLNNKIIKSYSDTATIFELFKTISVRKSIGLMRGMFAFSFFDLVKNKLTLSVDRFSIKPLYYINTPDFFVYSSEIKSLTKIPGLIFEFNEKSLGEYMMFRSVYGKCTLFKGVKKLVSGEFLTYDLSKNKTKTESNYLLGKKDYTESLTLEGLLEESVKKHLMGDFPVGIQLSGGVDSSLVCHWAKKFSQKTVYTFSIGLENNKWNEFKYSDFVSNKLKTRHQKIIFSKEDFVELFPYVTYLLDEPIVHANTIPMYILAKKAREYTKVLLTGEGADEIFLGYSRYLDENDINSNKIFLSNSFSSFEEINKLVHKKYINLSKRESFIKNFKEFDYLDKKSTYDIYTYLPDVLLRQDRAGMGANIENRIPFLDALVVEKGFFMKDKIGVYGGKSPLKEIALKYFPRSLVLRKKCGFGLPIDKWLRDKDALLPYLVMLKDNDFIKKYFNQKIIEKLIQEHLSKKFNNSSILFTLISLMVWHSVFIDNIKRLNEC